MPSFSNVLKQLPIRDVFSADIVGDSKRAAKIYGLETGPIYPALNHQFFVQFTVNTGAGWKVNQNLSFYIKSFDRPSVTFDTVELHQYNKRRMVQTGLHYGPVNVSFYDTNNRELQLLFVQYCRWYYGDFAAGKTGKSWNNDIVSPEFISDLGGWGFTPNVAAVPNNQYYFSHIDLYDVSPDGSYVIWRMMHPLIENWTLGNNDYEGNQQKMVNFTFKHEGFDIIANHGQAGAFELDQQFMISELSQHAELPSATRSFLNTAAAITRDISSENYSNIATRLGLPFGGIIQSIQEGEINPEAIGSDAIRVLKGSSALNSFGNFVFGDVASAAGDAIGGVVGEASSLLGLSESGNAAGLSPAAGAAAARRGGFVSNVDNATEVSVTVEDTTQTEASGTTTSPTILTPQVRGSEEGRAALKLETSVSGTDPGVVNPSGTELGKNYVNTAVAIGKPDPQPGIDTNKYQEAQGLVQTGRRLPDDFRDALAGAIVNASKRTNQPVSTMAAPTSPSTATTKRGAGSERELALTSRALREVNRLKPASAQYGYKGQGLLNSNDPDARRLIAAKRG